MADNDDYMVPKAYDDTISELMWDRLQEGINANRRFRLRGIAGGNNMRYSSTKVVWDSDIYIYFTRESDGAWVYNKINTNPTTGITCGNDDLLYVTLNDTTATVLTVSTADYTGMPTDDTGRILILGSVRGSRWYGVSSTDLDHTKLLNVGTNSHSQIDTHLGSTSNPHSVDWSDVSGGHTAAAHSGISVTDLSDVTSAGSGIIITDAERTGLHAQSHALSGGDHSGDLAYTQIDAIVDISGTGANNLLSRADHVHTDADGSSKVTYSNLSSIPSEFTPSSHDIISTHTGSPGTAGYVIRASGVSAFVWAQLSHSDLNDDESTQHFLQSAITTVGTVTSGDVTAIDSIGKISSKATGDIFYWSTVLQRLGTTGASSGDVLTLSADPPTGIPQWSSPGAPGSHTLDSASHSDIPTMTEAEGDIIYRNASNQWVNLPKGSDNYTLMMNGNVPNWEDHTGSSAHHTKYALTDDLIANEIAVIKAIDDASINNTKWDYLAACTEPIQTHMSASNPHSGSAGLSGATFTGDIVIDHAGDDAILEIQGDTNYDSLLLFKEHTTPKLAVYNDASSNIIRFHLYGNENISFESDGIGGVSLIAGATIKDVDTVMQSSPSDNQLLTALGIKNYVAGRGPILFDMNEFTYAIGEVPGWVKYAYDGTTVMDANTYCKMISTTELEAKKVSGAAVTKAKWRLSFPCMLGGGIKISWDWKRTLSNWYSVGTNFYFGPYFLVWDITNSKFIEQWASMKFSNTSSPQHYDWMYYSGADYFDTNLIITTTYKTIELEMMPQANVGDTYTIRMRGREDGGSWSEWYGRSDLFTQAGSNVYAFLGLGIAAPYTLSTFDVKFKNFKVEQLELNWEAP